MIIFSSRLTSKLLIFRLFDRCRGSSLSTLSLLPVTRNSSQLENVLWDSVQPREISIRKKNATWSQSERITLADVARANENRTHRRLTKDISNSVEFRSGVVIARCFFFHARLFISRYITALATGRFYTLSLSRKFRWYPSYRKLTVYMCVEREWLKKKKRKNKRLRGKRETP